MIKPADVLFAVGGRMAQRYGTLARRTRSADAGGEANRGSYTRVLAAWTRHPDGVFRKVLANRPRIGWYDLDGDGVRETPAYLVEPGVNHILGNPSQLDTAATPWQNNGQWTAITARTSLIAGESAYEHHNDGGGSRSRMQNVGGVTAATKALWALVENVDADETALSLWDSTGGSHVHLAHVEWADGTLVTEAGSGLVFARQEADAGPNGGPVYWFAITGTPGATNLNVFIYPTGTGTNTKKAIVHHVQYEERATPTTTPIPEGSGTSRTQDRLAFNFYNKPGPMQIYSEVLDLGGRLINDGYVWHLGDSSTGARFLLRAIGNNYQVLHSNGINESGIGSVVSTPLSTYYDRVELLATLGADGSVLLEQSINGGASAFGGQSAGLTLASAWGETILNIGCIASGGSNLGSHAHLATIGTRENNGTMQDFRVLRSLGVAA